MLKFLLVLALLLSCRHSESQKGDIPTEFTRLQLQQDLDQLISSLEEDHPGLYWYQIRTEFEVSIRSVEKEIENGLNLLEYYASIRKLLAGIGCGHTRARIPTSRMEVLVDSMWFIPFNISIINNGIFLNQPNFNEIPNGSKLISIGKYNTEEVLTELRAMIPSDGFNISGKDHYISSNFQQLYSIYFQVQPPAFDLSFLENGSPKHIEIKPVRFNELNTEYIGEPLLSLVDSHLDETKILNVKTFSEGALSSNGFDYYNFMVETFKNLKDTNTKNLIIDVRGNGGGNDDYGATLVSYITDRPFGYFESIKVTDAYSGYGTIVEEDGKRYMTSHRDLAVQHPAQFHFEGDVYILADGGSFSTTADFVSISKEVGAATIIGIETGGGACGNTSGSTNRIKLVNTAISISIPMWNYRSAIRPQPCGHGVSPDLHAIDLTHTEVDEVIENTLSLIRNKKRLER